MLRAACEVASSSRTPIGASDSSACLVPGRLDGDCQRRGRPCGPAGETRSQVPKSLTVEPTVARSWRQLLEPTVVQPKPRSVDRTTPFNYERPRSPDGQHARACVTRHGSGKHAVAACNRCKWLKNRKQWSLICPFLCESDPSTRWGLGCKDCRSHRSCEDSPYVRCTRGQHGQRS
jgi:hypothetical protein